MTKILLIDEHKTVNYAGGVERVLAAFANAFSARGYEVAIACMDEEKGAMFFPLDSSVRFHNFWYEYGTLFGGVVWFWKKIEKEFLRTFAGGKMIFAGKKIRDPKKEFFFSSFIERLRKLVEDFQPDVILSITAESAYIAQTAVGSKQIPVIAMCHTEPTREAAGYGEREFSAWQKSACVQVLMDSFLPTMERFGVKHAIRIPNFVHQVADTDLADLTVPHNRIVAVGRVDGGGKDQHILIEAFSLLAERFPDWSVHLYGDIANRRYKKRLDALIAEKNLLGRVIFEGTTKDIGAVYHTSDIFAFPSSFEGFPLALTEAMSVGLPAVGRKSCISVNELIKDCETGLLVEEGAERFAAALNQLMSDGELRARIGRAAHEAVKAYQPKKVWDMWENVIREVAGETIVLKGNG
ncbi:MAG: glycosyltransferase [Schwartzia sp.]|nr:glycosyltransferase [Schwartzia sp. (in: firmicutes)]